MVTAVLLTYHFNIRSGEHLGMSHLTGKRVECKQSAVSDHFLLQNYDSDFRDFTILCWDNNGFRLLLKKNKDITSVSLIKPPCYQ